MKKLRYTCGHTEDVKPPVTEFQASVQKILGEQVCPTCKVHARVDNQDYDMEEG